MAPWNISTASFSQSFQLITDSAYQDLFIRADGLKMYTLIDGNPGPSILREYNLSTAWNITTASFVQSIFFSGDEVGGIFFKPDGTKMFRTSLTLHRVFQYSLSTPWNISTATLDLGSRNISEDNELSDIFFRPDGLKMYVEGWENSKVYEYTLSVPWSVTSAVSTGFKDISAQDPTPVGLWFEPTTGKKMYVNGSITSNSIYEYNLSTPWSVSTAVFFQTLSVNAQDTEPGGIVFRDNGLQMFIIGDNNDRVYAYTLPPTPPKNFTVKALLVPDIWKFREHKTSIGVFDPVYTFQRESGAPNRFQMIGGSGTALGNGYLFKSFPIADIIGSDIKVIWTDISSSFGDVRISVYDGAYDPSSQADFPDAVSFPTDITPKGGGLLGSISDVETGITVFPVTTTLLALNINYANSVTGFITVFIINSDSQQVPFSNLLFSSIEITKLAKYNFNNAQVTNVLTGTVRDWGVVSAGSIQSFVFGSCSDISTSAGWTIVNGGGQILIDDPSAPDLIKLNNLTSGSGGRYAWMDIGTTISGDVKLEFKLDYTSNSGVSPEFSIGFVDSIVHPQFPLTNHVIRVDILASIERFGVLNGFVNGAGGSRTTTSGAKNQHAVWVYPNSNSPVSDSSLKGPYYVTVELKNNKLRLSVYKDQAKTQHMRGSPREVDATGVIPQNLRYIIVANSIFATGRVFNGTVDDVCISKNANSLPIIPPKVSPATGTFTEDWEGYFTGDQNPTPWISKTEINDGFDLLTVLPTTNVLNFGTAGDLRGIAVSSDGTKFYTVGDSVTKLLKQWTLITPYDLSTAIFVQSITITGAGFPQTGGLFFKPDGTKFFITFSNDDQVYQWTLTTPFDISTAIQGVPKCVRTPPNPCNGDGSQGTLAVSFSPDGINMYIGNFLLPAHQLTQWVLSTPWDVTTAVLVRVLVGHLPAGTAPRSQFFKSDGTKMFLMSGSASIIITNSRIDEYVLSTPWDISTAIWNQKSFDPGLGNFATAITFSLDGLKMYTSGTSSVFEYNLAPASSIGGWDISTATLVNSFSVSAQSTTMGDIFFKPDGTRMYAIGFAGSNVYEYALSTPWDVSTATLVQFKSTQPQEMSPQGLFFRADGLKMYTVRGNNSILEWNLTIPWDISTLLFLQSFIPIGHGTTPMDISFSPDGVKMYTIDFFTPDDTDEYVLSIPWNISTATFIQSYNHGAQEMSADAQFFKPDGTTMYIMGELSKNIYEYRLSSPWDISTSTFIQMINTGPINGTFGTGLFFRDDGLKMYVGTNNTISEYNLDPPTISPSGAITDIHEVSTSNPINGLKAFKIDQKYHRVSGFPWGRASVSRFVPAIVTTNGSGLDMPISLNASMRTSILSSFSSPVGVMVGYEFISGAPIGSILGLPFIETSARGILFKLYGTAVGSKAYMWNGTEWISNSTLDIPISLSNTVGTVAGINQQNLKDILNNSATLSNIYGIDFESHVTGMWIGYVGLNRSTLSVDTEVLINADNILLQNAGIKIRQFFIDAILPTRKIDFFIDAIMSPTKKLDFKIDALIPPIPRTFTVGAKVVNRFASNSCYINAILAGTSVINLKNFLIDANLSKIKDFTIDVILVKIRKIDSFIDAQLHSLANIKIFKIDAIIGALTEPQFILDVESTIGFKGVGHGV